jgi:Type I phosphodiesterase / nucleotide pyrophosphatase
VIAAASLVLEVILGVQRRGVCVLVRDLIVFGVLTDMMRGKPAVYATFSSHDAVAHHSGLERPDTLEALRKLDQQFGRIARARQFAPRPYELVVLSDHGQTQGATFKQRNGYTLGELVDRSIDVGTVSHVEAADENDAAAAHAWGERRGGSTSTTMATRWRRSALGRPPRSANDVWLPVRRFATCVRRRAPGVVVRVLAPNETIEP